MEIIRPRRKIGEIARRIAACALLIAGYAGSARAGDVEFSATVDRAQISLDESVSLKFSVGAEGASQMGQLKFHAPDFEVINEYSGTFIKSYYENGRFGMRNEQSLTKVLKPLKQGTLRINGMSVSVNGKVYTAPDLTVAVSAGGARTPPPQNYGGGGVGLRGAGKRYSGKSVFVRAEIDKDTVYKGEQLIVSYYLYRRVRVFNIQVDKYPILNGFLRQDLELPVLSPRLDSERVLLDGTPFERSLLLRYAAYPLQDGKLYLDSVALKYNYYTSNSGMDDEDPFQGFFNMMTPRAGQDRSEQVQVTILPLPEAGRPPSFTGGVGDFNLTASADKYDVRANEAVTLTVKVDGRGNVASIGEPKIKWPDNLELYDSKGKVNNGKAGVGDKTFEFLLIPRAPGKIKIPTIDFSFFDPNKKEFVTRSVNGPEFNVLDPAPGSPPIAPKSVITPGQSAQANPTASGKGKIEDIAPLKGADAAASVEGPRFWRWLYWLSGAAFLLFFGWVGHDLLDRGRATARAAMESRAKAEARSFERLKVHAQKAVNGATWNEVTQNYELLTGLVFDALDRAFNVGARSLPRSELRRLLVEERGIPDTLWERTGKLLEYAEVVRYATSFGAVSEASARNDLAKWVIEGEALVRAIERPRNTVSNQI